MVSQMTAVGCTLLKQWVTW